MVPRSTSYHHRGPLVWLQRLWATLHVVESYGLKYFKSPAKCPVHMQYPDRHCIVMDESSTMSAANITLQDRLRYHVKVLGSSLPISRVFPQISLSLRSFTADHNRKLSDVHIRYKSSDISSNTYSLSQSLSHKLSHINRHTKTYIICESSASTSIWKSNGYTKSYIRERQ